MNKQKGFLLVVAEELDLINRRSSLKFEDKFLNNNKILFYIVFVENSIKKQKGVLFVRDWGIESGQSLIESQIGRQVPIKKNVLLLIVIIRLLWLGK